MRDDEYKYYRPDPWDGVAFIHAYKADGSQDSFIVEGLVLMTDEEVDAYYERINTPDPAAVENAWREAELAVAKDNLEAIEFDDPDALPGTEAEWKEYGRLLRRWKEGAAGWPDKANRPKRPE